MIRECWWRTAADGWSRVKYPLREKVRESVLSPMEVYEIAFPPAGVAATIGLLLAISYFMMARLFGGELEQKAKAYLQHAVSNFVLLAVLPVGIYFLSQLGGVLAGYGGMDHFLGAKTAIIRLESSLKALYFNLFTTHLMFSFLTGFHIHMTAPLPGMMGGATTSIGFNFFGGMDIMLDKLDGILTQLIIIYGMLAGRAVLLELSPLLFVALFPIGILLRGFPWLKKTGSSIIALTVALYFVFPISVLLSDHILFESGQMWVGPDFVPTYQFFIEGSPDEAADILEETIKTAESQTVEGVSGRSPLQVVWDLVKPFFKPERLMDITLSVVGSIMASFPHAGVKAVGVVLAGIGAAPLLAWLSEGILSLNTTALLFVFTAAYTAAVLMVGVFISLLLEITITVTAFRAIGQIIGGETALLGLTRLV